MTPQQLRTIVTYDPITGFFWWNDTKAGRRRELAGGRVQSGGRSSKSWYIGITIDYRRYLAHRLAFFYMLDRWPLRVDHIDHDGLNNAWQNLREVAEHTNNLNKRLDARNTSGVAGVTKNHGAWSAMIGYRGKRYYLGRFKEFDAAVAARKKAEREFGFHPNHGV